MNLEDFEKRYRQARQADDITESTSVEFVKYPSSVAGQYALRREEREFLEQTGLPRQAAPYLTFENVYERYPQLDGYFNAAICIGYAGGERLIAIDGYSGKVECLILDDEGLEKQFVNSSLEAFTECLCLFEECVDKTQLHAAYQSMCLADDALEEEDNFWRAETEAFMDNVLKAVNEAINRRGAA